MGGDDPPVKTKHWKRRSYEEKGIRIYNISQTVSGI